MKKKTTYKIGRKTTLTEELLKTIIEHSELGLPDQTMFMSLGIPKSTWYQWKNKGTALIERTKIGKIEYKTKRAMQEAQRLMDFTNAVKKGRQIAIARCVKIIHKAAEETWQAAAWYLERVAFETYGRKETIKQDINMKIKKDSPIDEMLRVAKKAKELGYAAKDIIASNN